MDSHYHTVDGVSVYVFGVHVSQCPLCSPPAKAEKPAHHQQHQKPQPAKAA
jgi:hypothetical protein